MAAPAKSDAMAKPATSADSTKSTKKSSKSKKSTKKPATTTPSADQKPAK